MMDALAISELMSQLTTLLLLPVIALLLGMLLWSVFQVGGFVVEAWVRRRRGCAFSAFIQGLRAEARPGLRMDDVPSGHELIAGPMEAYAGSPRLSDKLLDDAQLRAERLLGRLHLGVRLGPMLGLAGTLIPLGPALTTLAEGDTARLAHSLIVAFATTVLGIVIGGLCFAMHGVRKQWYSQDLSDLAFLFGQLEEGGERR